MLLNLLKSEAAALRRELAHCHGDADLDAVRGKLDRVLTPDPPTVIPGQTTIDEQIAEAAA